MSLDDVLRAMDFVVHDGSVAGNDAFIHAIVRQSDDKFRAARFLSTKSQSQQWTGSPDHVDCYGLRIVDASEIVGSLRNRIEERTISIPVYCNEELLSNEFRIWKGFFDRTDMYVLARVKLLDAFRKREPDFLIDSTNLRCFTCQESCFALPGLLEHFK
jgi:hypothetical protein